MTFKDKIDKIVRVNRLDIHSPSGLEKYIGAGVGAITKYLKNDEEPGEDTIKKILDVPGLNKDWWETGQGPVFIAASPGNHTHIDNGATNPQKAHNEGLDEMLEKVESSRDYFVIPRAVLKENYRLVALEQFELEKQKLDKERADMLAQREKDRVYLEAQIEANRDLSRKLDLLIAKLADVQKSQ